MMQNQVFICFDKKRQATEFPLPAPERVEPYLLIFVDAACASAVDAVEVAVKAGTTAEDAADTLAVEGAFVCGSADCKAADGYACGHESHHDFLHCLLSFLF